MFRKLNKPINQGIRLLNLGQRKWLTWHLFLHTLASKPVSQIFVTCVSYYFFYKRIKLERGKNRTAHENRYSLLMREIIRIRRDSFSVNVLTTFSLNFSHFSLGAADLELVTHAQLAYFLLSRNREKIKFCGIQVLLDYRTKGDTTEESTPQAKKQSITF